MAEKNNKALVIKVRPSAEPAGVQHVWDKLNIHGVTKNILTPTVGSDKSGAAGIDVGAIVSGMPSVFARAILFRNALDHFTDPDMEADGLIGFYKTLVDEWRGLIACVALNNSDIEVRRIALEYSDGKPLQSTANVYEPKGAFGNLLFERKPLWCDPTTKKPVIDVVKYKGRVVGACSPDSFLFTSASYKLDEKAPFLSSGRFTDPLKAELDPARLNLLFGYVQHLRDHITAFADHYDDLAKDQAALKPNFERVSSNLNDWSNEIEGYAAKRGYKLNAQVPEISLFKLPYALLLNHTTELYGFHGVVSGTKGAAGGFRFDPRNILLPTGTEITQVHVGAQSGEFLAGRALHLLKADVKGGEAGKSAYFTVPLTPLGLAVFGRNVGALLGQGSADMGSRLSGTYDPATDELAVSLKLITDTEREITREQKYRVGSKMIKNRDVLLWPNFISEKWGKYYLYNELPHNDSGLQATPIVACMEDGQPGITPRAAEDGTPNVELLLAATNGKALSRSEGPHVHLLVASDHAVADVPYKYEIYESDTPFIGLRVSQAGKDQGYVLLRYGSDGQGGLRNLINDGHQIDDVDLGVDFGSTNTSVAYYSAKDGEPRGMVFRNRRVSLFGSEKEKEGGQQFAVENEIFFFQNEAVQSNSIKSVLTLHDHRRIVKGVDHQTAESLAAQPIKGGFPCFEKNLPIDTANQHRYHLKYGSAGKVDLVHNMKWSEGVENSYKAAYLSSLLLHVYAQLFEEGKRPVTLKWSYPSAMSQAMVGTYNEIWARLVEVSPLTGERPLVISEATGRLNPSGAARRVSGASAAKWGAAPAQPAASPGQTGTADDQGRYNFIELSERASLTEACAVANFIAANKQITKTKEYLTLCFDVGGSTTDIMALCMVKDPQGGPGGRLAMVKQNSIRFAAQRLSQASQYSHRFRDVLLDVCEKHKFSFSGLNKGENKYNPGTAPYFFEQLIDRLDEKDLPSLYRSLHAKCPELFWVNLYVTGLIMFYAGQLASKLQTEISRSPERIEGDGPWTPNVNVLFAGKGARIFDWFYEVNRDAARKYYMDLFIEGFGGEIAEHRIKVRTPAESPVPDVKYEVSKGLALPTKSLLVPQENKAVEIIGEEHFKRYDQTLSSTDSITGELMGLLEGGASFYSAPPSGELPCPRFAAFADIYYTAATELFGLRLTRQDFYEGFMNLNIEAYIQGQPEYQQALKAQRSGVSEKFDYVAPIIILEGMKFLEDVILPKLANAR